MHTGHKKVHLILIAQSLSDTLILSHFHFQIAIYHLTLVTAFFSKIWRHRDCDFASTCIKKEKVMSNIKPSFLSGQLETRAHCSSLSRERWPIWGRVFGAYWPWSSIPGTAIGLKSHKMQNQITWPHEIWAEVSEFEERQRATWCRHS